MHRILLIFALINLSAVSCLPNQWLAHQIPVESLPTDYATTTLLISEFEYTPPNEIPRSERRLRNHTNRHLSKLNGKLARQWQQYNYAHKVVRASQIDSLYPDTEQYRYVVHRLVTFRTSADTRPVYQYYLYDRKRRKRYRDIAIYSNFFWQTTKVLIHKLNRNQELMTREALRREK